MSATLSVSFARPAVATRITTQILPARARLVAVQPRVARVVAHAQAGYESGTYLPSKSHFLKGFRPVLHQVFAPPPFSPSRARYRRCQRNRSLQVRPSHSQRERRIRNGNLLPPCRGSFPHARHLPWFRPHRSVHLREHEYVMLSGVECRGRCNGQLRDVRMNLCNIIGVGAPVCLICVSYSV